MESCWIVLLLLLTSSSSSSSSSSSPPPPSTSAFKGNNDNNNGGRRIHLTEGDSRLVTCRDLANSERAIHRDGKIFDYAVSLVKLESYEVIVGARNHLLRLNLSNLEVLEKVEASPDHITTSTCLAKGQSKDDCHNFFRVIIREGSKILTCGTNSFSPLCQWRKIDSLSEILSTISGVGKCPYSPQQNSTLIMTSDQNLYGATVTDFAARDPAIYRMMGQLRHLRTNQYNSRWLNEPDFVSSYEMGPYVYFFFRETAIEYINCGKVIYSRVARICQNDQGGNVLLQDNWTTFSKARLNCSIPGSYPFHVNEIQNTFLDIEHELIYAIFTTSPTGILGSAVCLFNLSSLEYAFHGPFKYQHDSNSAWSRYPNKLPHYQCGHNLSRHTAETTHGAHILLETSKYQLMDRAVQPQDFHPVVMVEDQRYTHISKDEVWLPRQNISVVILFLASLSGYIDKMTILPVGRTASCLVERIRLSCGFGQKIMTMELIKKEKYLVVGTHDGLHKIPVHRCSRFSNKISCHNSQDPYCGWDDKQNSCKAIGHQNFSSCPIIVNLSTIDKSINSCNWSPWQQCHHVTRYNYSSARSPGDRRCLCRTRDCACHYRMDGGDCEGNEVEITNCSYPSSKKYLSSSSHWLPWSEWSNCIGRCSKGHQTRTRLCHSTRVGCYGNSIDIRECKADSCDVSDSKAVWSNWHVTKENKVHRVEEKHRCTCKINPALMTSNPILETVTRTCNNNLNSCSNESLVPEIALLSWSDWSECSVTCGYGGIQKRHKLCFSSNYSCNIESQSHHQTFQEVRSCNSRLPCQTSFWSCWSPLSSCSATCGRGVKYRTRVCLDWLKVTDISNVDEGQQSDWCPGVSRQEMICETHSCNQNYVSFTADGSFGQSEFFDFNYDHPHTRNITQSDSSIQSYHLIIVGIICFFLGGIVIIIVLSHCKLSFLFAKERYPASKEGDEKCNAVAAFTSDGVRTVATRYSYFASNGVAPVADNISQKDGSNITNSSKTPLISAKRLANTCQR